MDSGSYPGGVRIKAGVVNVATRGVGVLVKWCFLAAKGGDQDFEVLAAVGRLMPLTVPDVLTQLRCCLAISVASFGGMSSWFFFLFSVFRGCAVAAEAKLAK